MKKHNPKLWRMCGQHVNASDDKCTDLKRHGLTEFMFDNLIKAIQIKPKRGIHDDKKTR